MNLTLKQLRAFVTVADLQSFSLAAERLSLTPGAAGPAATRGLLSR